METYLGTIILFAGNFVPQSFAACNGQLLTVMQNQALYSVLGTKYGGDGVTTFGLPNLNSAALDNSKGGSTPMFIICTEGLYPVRP